MRLPPAYNLLISLTVTLGSITYGYAVGSLANALGKAVFYESMGLDPMGPGKSYANTIIAVWNTIIYASGLITCLLCPIVADRFGRRKVLALGALVSVLGAALQAGGQNVAMVIAARIFVGFGIGILIPCVPLYQAEISPASNRGIIVGLHASLIGYGTMLATWIGVAFYHVPGDAGWRVPMAIQTVPPLLLFILVWFIPESPRWLYMHDRADEAERVLTKLHATRSDPDHTFSRKEMAIIRRQLDYEKLNRVPVLEALRRPSMRKRFIVGFLSFWNTQCSGVIVVLAYQAIIYESLGYSPFFAGILGSIWCVVLGTGNLIGGILGDYIGRKKQFTIGLILLDIDLILLCITTKLYTGTTNNAGKIAAVVFTFFQVAIYTTGVECASLVYSSELFPGEWRAWGVGWSLSAVLWGGMIFTAAAPSALTHIGAYYYIVFIVLTAIQVVVIIFYFPNTKGFTLEQMAAVFGDDVVNMHGAVEKGDEFVREHQQVEDVDLSTEDVTEVQKIV